MGQTVSPPDIERVSRGDNTRNDETRLYNVVLLDDDHHTYDYVIEMLQKLFSCSANDAYLHATEVDMTGRTIVVTCPQPEAEYGRDQIHAYGPDPRMPESKGSMTAIIEPLHRTN